MPSPRRMRLLMLATVATVVFLLFYTSGLDGKQDPEGKSFGDFYHKTNEAMQRSSPPGQPVMDTETGKQAGHIPADKDADGDVDDDDKKAGEQMQAQLRASELEAKDKANKKGGMKPDPPSNVVGMGSSAEGQGKKGGVQGEGSGDAPQVKDEIHETEEEHNAAVELTRIMKQSPVIIISKSYCPFSKRAKGLLLEKYNITPDPYVYELDQHDLANELQDLLLAKTKRRTVPNIMINGISIGGADDIIELDNQDKLIGKIIELGNKRVEVKERFVSGKAV